MTLCSGDYKVCNVSDAVNKFFDWDLGCTADGGYVAPNPQGPSHPPSLPPSVLNSLQLVLLPLLLAALVPPWLLRALPSTPSKATLPPCKVCRLPLEATRTRRLARSWARRLPFAATPSRLPCSPTSR